ncbi:DUF4288 domain-containing protein [Pedobacter punctiformis]|uniref:DUF4288 domain-containing protein n=1 Tax=Pedobacter punctiformis TaxID=3004097 RepID=A0ABT4LCT9_9SPHI|nr:DUF4288 domain-containing protein [Pedobacter sp. HCMS5-2]MCZ4245737.1 DUF4288 domain-containing protein [Pedobacter sp. HCMS5-2]
MKWFAVNYVYQIICGEGKHTPQFNEQIRLIKEIDIKSAFKKAKMLATEYNSSFKNFLNENVIWEFVGVGGIAEIVEPGEGVEISSVILEPVSVKDYLEKIKHRNKLLTETN